MHGAPEVAPPVYIHCRRYAPGVVPTCFLNAVAKCCEEENPHSNAISLIVRWLEVSRLFARSTRRSKTNCHGENPVAVRKPEAIALVEQPIARLKSAMLKSSAR